MQYRALANRQEMDSYLEMVRLAFLIPRDELSYYEALDPYTADASRGLFDDSGRLLCAMYIIQKGALYFGTDRPLTTALITAVASPPEYRRKGYIRELFEGMYAEQREQGVALTALYPFYFPFYRAFGYELAHDSIEHTIKIDQFKPWRDAAKVGRFEPVDVETLKKEAQASPNNTPEGDGDLNKLAAIYDRWAARNLGTILRTPSWWLRKLVHKMDFVQGYIYYNPEGQPAGYIIYRFEEKGEWVRDMIVREVMGVDRQALDALYGFIYNHDSQAEKVKIWTPVDSALTTQLLDPREDEAKLHAGYMLRLLHIEEAFRQRKFRPEAHGEFAFALTDPMVPANNGTYRVRVSEGSAEIEHTGSGTEGAGLRLNERVLAQVYGGYLSPARAAELGLLEVLREEHLRGMDGALHPPGQPASYMADGF